MAAIPKPFDTIRSVEDAEKWLTGRLKMETTITKFKSACESLPNEFVSYINRLNEAATMKEKTSIIAGMTQDTLRKCNPARVQLYLMSDYHVSKALAFFMENEDAKTLATMHYSKYLAPNSECNSMDEMRIYTNSVRSFREHMAYTEPELATMLGVPTPELIVGTSAGYLTEMLSRMIRKRKVRITGSTGSTPGANHANDAMVALAGGWDEVMLLPWKGGILAERKAEGNGLKKDGDVWVSEPHALLLSTAMLFIKQSNREFFDSIVKKLGEFKPSTEIGEQNKGIIERAIKESELFENASREEAEGGAARKTFSAQESNIDPVWLTFFIAGRICKLSSEDFYKWQRAIYVATRLIKGKDGIRSTLQSLSSLPGVTTLLQNTSKSTKIHSPPWVFNLNRIYDMAAVIGACDSRNPLSTIAHPSISWRNFLMIDWAKTAKAIAFLITLDEMEVTVQNEEGGDIIQAERILQQLIVGRSTPLECTNFVSGNALRVKIVGTNEEKKNTENYIEKYNKLKIKKKPEQPADV